MSRSASFYVEGGSRAREIRAEEIYETACEEGRQNGKRTLPIWGDDTTFHMNTKLLNNCIQSQYFQKCCLNLHNWTMIIDEIYYEVKNMNVYINNNISTPSTAFCLLLRLFTIRMNQQQLLKTLQHVDSPYIRAIGFLYLRYVGIPETIYQYIEPYLYDNEEFVVTDATKKGTSTTITIGTFVRNIFQSREYNYGGQATTLPRYPLVIERILHVQLLAADRIYERAIQHYNNPQNMQLFTKVGNKVMALYCDSNTSHTDAASAAVQSPQLPQQQWYEAEIDRIITRSDDDVELLHPKFVITFVKLGITKTVHLGEIDVMNDRSKGHHPVAIGYNRNNTSDDLYDEVRRREQEQVAISQRHKPNNSNNSRMWNRQQRHEHPSLSTQQHSTNGNRSTEPINEERYRGQAKPFDYAISRTSTIANSSTGVEESNDKRSNTITDPTEISPPLKRNAEEIAAIAEKKRKLIAKYG